MSLFAQLCLMSQDLVTVRPITHFRSPAITRWLMSTVFMLSDWTKKSTDPKIRRGALARLLLPYCQYGLSEMLSGSGTNLFFVVNWHLLVVSFNAFLFLLLVLPYHHNFHHCLCTGIEDHCPNCTYTLHLIHCSKLQNILSPFVRRACKYIISDTYTKLHALFIILHGCAKVNVSTSYASYASSDRPLALCSSSTEQK